MNRLAIIAAALGLVAVPAVAQDSTSSEVLGTIDRFFAALNSKDPEGMKAVMTAKGYIRVASYAKGRPPYRERTFEEDWVQIGKTEEALREVYWDPTVLVHRDIAVAWMPYSFDYDGKRSHCGVDVFDLVRIAGEWKITAIMYTVEPEDCPKGR